MTSPSAVQATLKIGSERSASLAADTLSENYPDDELAVAAFEAADGTWDVTMHFAAAPNEELVRSLIGQALGPEAAQRVVFEIVAEKDWVRSSLEGLAPVRAGRFIVHGSHDRSHIPPNAIGIEVEAGLAFGTGHHATTRGCLLLLDRVLASRKPRRILDLGCGTGVLAIAAAKALKTNVLTTDIDARSVIVASDNARANSVGSLVRPIKATGFHSFEFKLRGPFDLALANILAAPLRQLAQPMARHIAPSGYVILSGLLAHQTPAVVAAYKNCRFRLVTRHIIDGWATLLMRKS